MRIHNLAGLFTGIGFREKDGRSPTLEDCGFIPGPVTVDIDDSGTIAEISSISRPRAGANTFDGTGLVATSGFVDSHTHALFAGQRFLEIEHRWQGTPYLKTASTGGGIHQTINDTTNAPDDELKAELQLRLQRMLAGGTTTLEIKTGYGGTPDKELHHLKLIKDARSVLPAPEVISTFLALHALPPGWSENDYCSAMIDVLPLVAQEQLASFMDCFPECGFFTLEQCLRLAGAAKDLNLAIKVHADEMTDLGTSKAFIRLGAKSIDHLQYISDEAVALLSSAKTVATLMPATSFYTGLPYANARKLLDAGARVALASDYNPGTAPTPYLQFTFVLAAAQLKMATYEILCACTYNGAAAVGIESTHGTLECGKAADILLWELQDHRAMTGVQAAHAHSILSEIIVGGSKPKAVFVAGRKHVGLHPSSI